MHQGYLNVVDTISSQTFSQICFYPFFPVASKHLNYMHAGSKVDNTGFFPATIKFSATVYKKLID